MLTQRIEIIEGPWDTHKRKSHSLTLHFALNPSIGYLKDTENYLVCSLGIFRATFFTWQTNLPNFLISSPFSKIEIYVYGEIYLWGNTMLYWDFYFLIILGAISSFSHYHFLSSFSLLFISHLIFLIFYTSLMHIISQ